MQDGQVVLTVEAVRWALDELRQSTIHPFFPAYLQLYSQSVRQESDRVRPRWDELAQLLEVGGGPPGKPYLRPFWNSHGEDANRFWLNANIAGSYAPSSVRNKPRNVIDIDGSDYILRPGHVSLAFEHLLYGAPASGIACAAFFLRDFGFTLDDGDEPTTRGLTDAFRRLFLLDGTDYGVLFHNGSPSQVVDWFELLSEDSAGIEV